jgi:hypothetical protein
MDDIKPKSEINNPINKKSLKKMVQAANAPIMIDKFEMVLYILNKKNREQNSLFKKIIQLMLKKYPLL